MWYLAMLIGTVALLRPAEALLALCSPETHKTERFDGFFIFLMFEPQFCSLVGPAHPVHSGEPHQESSREGQEPPEGLETEEEEEKPGACFMFFLSSSLSFALVCLSSTRQAFPSALTSVQ